MNMDALVPLLITTVPVEEPTQFDFVINLKTAKTLGLRLAPSLPGRADRVIE